MAWSYLRDQNDAFDAVGQGFVVAATKPDRIPDDDPWPWFSVVVMHEARNLRRKKRPSNLGDQNEDRMTELVDARSPEPSKKASDQETHERLWRELNALEDPEQDAILLTHVGGLTHAQAAQLLEVPRQTLTDRIRSGVVRLRQRWGGSNEELKSTLAVLPIVAPPLGWDVALLQWKSTAFASIPMGSAAATVALGGATMVKKSVAITIAIVALGMGFVARPTVDRLLGGGEPIGTESTGAGDGPISSVEELQSQAAAEEESEAARAREGLVDLRRENQALRGEVASLQDQLATKVIKDSLEAAESQPTFTFGEAGKLAAVLEADWSEMADASVTTADAILEIHSHQRNGTKPPKSVYLALQENTEKMRKYEYRSIDKLPTDAKHNGELTHPISLTNLIAAVLKRGGDPLSERQVVQINNLGLAFEENFTRLRAGHRPGVPRAARVLDEYLLKGEFTDNLYRSLTPAQRRLVINPDSNRVAFLDLYCPSLMIIHTSPIITGADEAEVRQKFTTILGQRYSLGEAQLTQLTPHIERFLAHCARLTEQPVEAYRVKNYTYDESVIAGEATAELLTALLDNFELEEETREKIIEDPAFFIPRLVLPQEPAQG